MARFPSARLATLACVWLFAAVAMLQAETVTFVIDPERSSLTSDAIAWAFGGIPLTGQDPPANTSLTASYVGTIDAEVDDPLNPTTITFHDAEVVAEVDGEWLPALGGGTVGDPDINGDGEPGMPAGAQFGYQVVEPGIDVFLALRDTVFALSSGGIPIGGSGFPSSVILETTQGVYDYNVSSEAFGDLAGSSDVTGETAENVGENGSYLVSDFQATLTLPIDAFFGGPNSDLEIYFSGEFVATANFGPSLQGDYNNNGRVEQADLDLVLLNWGESFVNIPAEWVNERPAAGIIDQAELDGVLLNWGNQTPPLMASDHVPEPHTLLLLLLAPTPLIARLRW